MKNNEVKVLFKYIGGKTWMKDIIRKSIKETLKNNNINTFIEPFAGGLGCFLNIYDLLIEKFQQNNGEFDEFNLNTFASLLYESSLHIDDNIKLHKHQMSILDKFEFNKQNRIFLSASTSFGKTYLVYEIIKKMNLRIIKER